MRHGDEPSAVLTWTVDSGVLRALRNGGAVPSRAAIGALARRLHLSAVRRCGTYELRAGRVAVQAVRRVLAPVQPDQRHDVRVFQVAAVALVPGNAAAHPVQE